MYDIDRKSCTACRKVGALHCSDPINCGQMKDESDNWMSWLDDLPVHAAFDEGIGCLQEYISALRAKLDAAEADKRQAVEREKLLARRIHMQRAQLRWLNAWMMGSLQSTRMNMLKRTLLTKRSPYAFGPDPEKLRAVWDVILRRVYGNAAIRTAPVHKAGCPGTGSHDETGG